MTETIKLNDKVFILNKNKVKELKVMRIITTRLVTYVDGQGPGEREDVEREVEEVEYVLQDEECASGRRLNRNNEHFTREIVFKTKEALANSLIED